MKNYELVNQWAKTVKVTQALDEIKNLKLKFPWLKCDTTLAILEQLNEDLPKMVTIIKHQEKQNAILREVIRVNKFADESIVNAIATRFNLEL